MSTCPCFCKIRPEWCTTAACTGEAMGMGFVPGASVIYCVACVSCNTKTSFHLGLVQSGLSPCAGTDIFGNGSQAAACLFTDPSGGHINDPPPSGSADPGNSSVADRRHPLGALPVNHDGRLCRCGYLPGMITCRTRGDREICPNRISNRNLSGYCNPCRVSFGASRAVVWFCSSGGC
jgi:hypothetical protein